MPTQNKGDGHNVNFSVFLEKQIFVSYIYYEEIRIPFAKGIVSDIHCKQTV